MGRRNKLGAWNEHSHTIKYKIDNQQGYSTYSTGNSIQLPIQEKYLKKNEYMDRYN